MEHRRACDAVVPSHQSSQPGGSGPLLKGEHEYFSDMMEVVDIMESFVFLIMGRCYCHYSSAVVIAIMGTQVVVCHHGSLFIITIMDRHRHRAIKREDDMHIAQL